MRRTTLITLLVMAGLASGAAPAAADQSPPGCGGSRFALDITKDRSAVRAGETINFWVELSNLGADACDVSNITIEYFGPGAAPGTTATTPIILSNTARYNNGTTRISFGPFPYVVPTVEAATPEVTARVRVQGGLLHDSPIDHVVDINKTVGTPIVTPGIKVDKVGSIESGIAPQNVTYTYTVTNTTTFGQTLDRVVVNDDLCPGPAYRSGDANGDGRLQATEAWVFTCTALHGAGEFVNTATACADLVLDSVSAPVCSPPDTWRVVLTTAQTAVSPQSVTQAPCTLSRVDKVTVRRNQTNTIRVRVRPVDAGTRVTIRLPGGKTVSARTNRSGVATLRFRPTRTGTARITAAECSDVERLTVRQARRTTASNTPRVTG